MNDNSRMPSGKYKNEKLVNVPADYLIWFYENTGRTPVNKGLIDYIEDNMQELRQELKQKKMYE